MSREEKLMEVRQGIYALSEENLKILVGKVTLKGKKKLNMKAASPGSVEEDLSPGPRHRRPPHKLVYDELGNPSIHQMGELLIHATNRWTEPEWKLSFGTPGSDGPIRG